MKLFKIISAKGGSAPARLASQREAGRSGGKEYLRDKPKIKKAVGVILILVGFAALITPLTPGSWLIFVGLELLGIRMLFWDKIKRKNLL